MTTNTTVNETPRNDLDRLRAHRKAEDVSKAKRIRKIMKAYLPLPRDEQVMAAIKDLMEHMAMALDQMGDGEARGRLTEGRVIVVVGLSGTGKTTVLQHAFAQVEALAGHADAHGDSMLVSMVAPSPGVSKQVALTLARRLGFDTKRNLQESQAWDLVRRQLVLRGVRFVHIDELQHVHQVPNPIEIQKVRDTLKNLVQNRDWPVSLILSGTPDIAAFLQADTQLRRRCVFVRFDSLDPRRDVAVVRSIVKQYCACGGLKQDGLVRDIKDESDRTTDEFALRLIHSALGEIGVVIEMVQDAATLAIRADDEVLSLRHFVKAYENRTGCASTQNVFLATDWQIIRVEAALYPERVLEEEERRDNRDKKRGRVA